MLVETKGLYVSLTIIDTSQNLKYALFNWLNIINLIQVYIQIMFTGMSCLQIGSTAHTIGPNILLQNGIHLLSRK